MQQTEEEKLKALGERGRKAASDADEAASRKKGVESRRDERQRSRLAKVSMTWLGEYWPDDVFDWVAWLALLSATPLIFPVPLDDKLPLGAALVGLFLVAMAATRVWGGFRFQKELVWLAALPFPVQGYVESLGDVSDRVSAPNVTGKAVGVTFRVRFASLSSVPVKDIFYGFDPKLVVSQDSEDWKIQKLDFLGGASNYPLHVYFHKLVEQALKPLSAQQPIASVTVRLDTFRNKMDDDREYMEGVFRHEREMREKRQKLSRP